ncbi:uncharacterized protein BDR25DRAFT_309431 [Lindgomyces ingoldianus]|uniref:Uncharacterized protein n=1 Tax=Lindgomyces ingoldianus TaxID=673940 RepID=A0ACB6RD11_9PLEO|nr:uncharacterized protein BDR25DRAFT_309431 [Lindgomyces ingoldianus]KAF2477134.1 hypothetical protein BDR25DRAFT_309431 [Lindgomyces ingoldianus]
MWFHLRVIEAGFSSATLLIFPTWYRRHEQSKSFMVFLSASILSGVFGGIVTGFINNSLNGPHGIAGWRWLFTDEGIAIMGAAFIAPFFLFDYPSNTKRLTARQRELAVARLQADGITSSGEHGEPAELSRRKTILHAIDN